MTALLVVFTFALFVAIDYVVTRRRERHAAMDAMPVELPPEAIPAVEPVWVAGYRMPEQLHYHIGHTWARVISPDTVAIGVDDFARHLLGTAEEIKLPSVGSWLRQGEDFARFRVNGRQAPVVAPVEGEVVEVNRELGREPSRTIEDPYGKGWLCKVRSAVLASNLRNLLTGGIAKRWMEEARERLEVQLMALSGSVLQDGGVPAPDFARHLEDGDWNHLVREFLLA